MADVVHVRNVKHYRQRLPTIAGDFKSLYRFEEENVQWLANTFSGESEESRGGSLSSIQRMKVCLRYLADPGYQKGIGQELGVDQATVSRTVRLVVDRIVAQANTWIKFPTSNQEIAQAKEIWQSKYRFPTAIGVLDCTHVGILKPRAHGDEYINRKGNPTLNVQATCDAKEIFTSVDVSWPGSMHDARIWKNLLIRLQFKNVRNAVLLADSGYGIEPCLMTPFPEPPAPGMEQEYNRLLKKERVIIERCFGQLKRRFPILQYVCRVKLMNVPKIIVACFVLHNVAKRLGDPDIEEVEEAPVEDDVQNCDIPVGERALREQGQEVRRTLGQIINNFN